MCVVYICVCVHAFLMLTCKKLRFLFGLLTFYRVGMVQPATTWSSIIFMAKSPSCCQPFSSFPSKELFCCCSNGYSENSICNFNKNHNHHIIVSHLSLINEVIKCCYLCTYAQSHLYVHTCYRISCSFQFQLLTKQCWILEL